MADHGCRECRRRGGLCVSCSAKLIWDALDEATRDAIDAAIREGAIAGLRVMRDATPPIRLPHAIDVLQFRYDAGVHHEADDR